MVTDSLFHFSFPIDDIEKARAFYGGLLGCPEGRKEQGRLDFNFFGHHIVAHLSSKEASHESVRIGKDKYPLRHFGVIIPPEQWKCLADKLTKAGIDFITPPGTLHQGTVREQWSMLFMDPCGNALEFKALKDVSRVFAE